MIIAAIKKAIAEEKAKKHAQSILLVDDVTYETIKQIARAYDYHFEIVRNDGTIFRFFKKDSGQTPQQGDAW